MQALVGKGRQYLLVVRMCISVADTFDLGASVQAQDSYVPVVERGEQSSPRVQARVWWTCISAYKCVSCLGEK